MRKSFFLSVLALAAVVSCQKSEIVDSKYGNDEIGFESYLGRTAQTKAAVADEFETAGIYGFYTGGKTWGEADGDNTIASPKANLWVNDPLTWAGTVTPARFWTNATDNYSFLAYAPKGDANISNFPTGQNAEGETVDVQNPTISFAVPTTLENQTDLLYASVVNVQKPTTQGAGVSMVFQHALARLTVNAKTAANQNFDFRVKKISINGGFLTNDILTLKTGSWTANGTPVAASTPETDTTPAIYPTTYTFYNEPTNATALTTSYTKYAEYKKNDEDLANNYLMMIPVNFTNQAANLTVEYTTFYEGQESSINKVTLPVTTNFEKGNAYAINLEFSKTTEEIIFTVTVNDWDETNDSEDIASTPIVA